MKKFISILLALCMVLSLLSACGKRMEGANEYAPIPYAWEEQRDGSYKFTITGETPEGYKWDISYDELAIQLGEPVTNKDGSISYKITPLEAVNTTMMFSLTSDDAIEHVSYRITMTTSYSEAGFLLTDDGYQEFGDEQVVGASTKYPLTYEMYDEFNMIIYLTGDEDADWETDITEDEGNSFFTVSQPFRMEGYVAYLISYGGNTVVASEESIEDLSEIAQGVAVEEEKISTATSVEEGYEAYEPTKEEQEEAEKANAEVSTAHVKFSLYKGNLSYDVTLTFSFNEGFQIESVKQGTYEKETPPYVGASLTADAETGDVFLTSDGTYQDRPKEFEFLEPDNTEDEGEKVETK